MTHGTYKTHGTYESHGTYMTYGTYRETLPQSTTPFDSILETPQVYGAHQMYSAWYGANSF